MKIINFNETGLPETSSIKKAYNMLAKTEKCGDWGITCGPVVEAVTKFSSRLTAEAMAAAIYAPVHDAQQATNRMFGRSCDLSSAFSKKVRSLISDVGEIENAKTFRASSEEVQALFLVNFIVALKQTLNAEDYDDVSFVEKLRLNGKLFADAKSKFPDLFEGIQESRAEALSHAKMLKGARKKQADLSI